MEKTLTLVSTGEAKFILTNVTEVYLNTHLGYIDMVVTANGRHIFLRYTGNDRNEICYKDFEVISDIYLNSTSNLVRISPDDIIDSLYDDKEDM